MQVKDIKITQVKHKSNLEDSLFLAVYEKLLRMTEQLTYNESFFILKLAVYFLNSDDTNLEQLGYRLILMYSNQTRVYKPLYDIALSRDYIPISKFIERKNLLGERSETFSQLYIQAFQESFKFDGDIESIYRSGGQMKLLYYSSLNESVAVVAPTSYGKSEMITRKIPNFFEQNICIIVPSKALLAQTKKVLLCNPLIKEHFRKIITHPDMFKNQDTPFLAVLTQERLLRLLLRHRELALDLILLDEAHNILEDTERSHLLAQVLLIAKARKPAVIVNFFTPFIVDTENLKIKNFPLEITKGVAKEFMKIERFYGYDVTSHEFFLYDQFLDRKVELGSLVYRHEIDFIINKKAGKNIIYLNTPRSVEGFALKMAEQLPNLGLSAEVSSVISSISSFIDPNYNLVTCIKKGILFHHGGMPDIIRLYVEHIYSHYPEFHYIITTSTLLEGVNIPAERIFILNPRKGRPYLTPSQFKNLIGRVCRFKEVFNNDNTDLKLLEPEIYLIKGESAPNNFSLLSFFSKKANANIKIKDSVENPLLDQTESEAADTRNVLEYLENMERGTSGLEGVEFATTDIGKSCFANNIHDFDIRSSEQRLDRNLRLYSELNQTIDSAAGLIDAIATIFFDGVELSEKSQNIQRIKEQESARNFYKMFIGWRIQGESYPYMINRFLRYWESRVEDAVPEIYVGSRWGDLTRHGHQALWVNLNEKTQNQKINLAVAKIKEEQEFIDFNILKYLEVLNELEMINTAFYDNVKYGTSDPNKICLLKNGFSMELTKLLLNHYAAHIEINLERETVIYSQELIDRLIANEVNDVLVFEAQSNL